MAFIILCLIVGRGDERFNNMFLSGIDSDSSTSSESTDREKDEDYVPKSDGDVSADSDVDPEFEVNQILEEEIKDLLDDNSAHR